MNGLSRLWGGGSSSVPPDSPTSPKLAPIDTSSPVLIHSGGMSWPPRSPSDDGTDLVSPQTPPKSPPKSPPQSPPKTTTAALFFRKDKQHPIPQPSSVDEGHRPSQLRSPPPARSPAFEQMPSIPSLVSPIASLSGGASPSVRAAPPSLMSQVTRKSLASANGTENGSTTPYSSRDQLLISLLSSEAIVDSRDYEVLDAEEVDELKKEHQLLSSRLVATTKKVNLEIKIRDAAVSLSKVNASYKKTAKQTAEQLEAAERKVEAAQKELWTVSERVNEVNRRLLEHRAAVLSVSIRAMERKLPGFNGPLGRSTPDGLPSPALSIATSASAGAKPRFEGAHLFAGHADAIAPQAPRAPMSDVDVAALEGKLKAATNALAVASKKQVEMGRELSLLRMEKEQVETSLGMDLQSAEETIDGLKDEIAGLQEREGQLDELEEQKRFAAQTQVDLGRKDELIKELRKAVEDAEARSADTSEADAQLKRLREESRLELEKLRKELQEAVDQRETDRVGWENERTDLELAHAAQVQQVQTEAERLQQEDEETLHAAESQIDEAFTELKEIVQTHSIVLSSRESSVRGLIASIGDHLVDLSGRMVGHTRATEEWEAARRKLQNDVQAGLDKRQELAQELELARNEREEARKEARTFESHMREQATSPSSTLRSLASEPAVQYSEDVSKLVAVLEPIWAILPSAEARGSKMGSRHFRAGSQSPSSPSSKSPNSPKVSTSLSEMDVRSLKALYDPNAANPRGVTPTGSFSIESFAQRVQALIADDRALIERLIRFAQAHDLLKKNAERAQKLVQESNTALETYQKQVKMLEDRNMSMMENQAAMEDELQRLQLAVDRITAEKREVESSAAEQAESLRHLQGINDTLSARTLGLAEEAAAAGEAARKKMESQLAECQKSLEQAEEEIGIMQERNMSLLEELNSLQTENNALRTQLRAQRQ